MAPPRRGTKYWTAEHLDFWKEQLGGMPIGAIVRGEINSAVATLQNQMAMKSTYDGLKPLGSKLT